MERKYLDFYPTPYGLAGTVLSLVSDMFFKYRDPLNILDPGCGTGVWGYCARKLWPSANIVWLDLRNIENNASYNIILSNTDFLSYNDDIKYELIIGNPPYYLDEEFVSKAFDLVTDNGVIVFLMRLAFLEGINRYYNFWSKYPLTAIFPLSRRPSFLADGTKRTRHEAYAIYLWKKNKAPDCFIGKFLNWGYAPEDSLNERKEPENSP